MTHDDFVKAAREAGQQLAATAITTPFLFPEYAVLQGCLQELEAAKAKLAKAEAVWLKRLQPALSDPTLRKLAEERGLLPPNVRAKPPEGSA